MLLLCLACRVARATGPASHAEHTAPHTPTDYVGGVGCCCCAWLAGSRARPAREATQSTQHTAPHTPTYYVGGVGCCCCAWLAGSRARPARQAVLGLPGRARDRPGKPRRAHSTTQHHTHLHSVIVCRCVWCCVLCVATGEVQNSGPEGLLVCFGVAQLSDIAVYQICTVSVLSFSSAQKMLGFCAGTKLKEVQNVMLA